MPKPTITNLVFQGGSVKGVAYIGALEVLEEKVDMTKIKRIAGTSAGAITAGLLALGCDIARVKQLMLELDFKKILDDSAGSIPTQPKLLRSIAKNEQGTSAFFSKIPVKTVKKPIAYRLWQQHGIYEGEYIREWIEQLILEQVQTLTKGEHDGVNLTFLELHELTNKYPGLFRDLSVIGSNLTLSKKMVFSHDNPETQHVIIADAIRISMSIPDLFKPHHVYCKIDDKRLIDVKRETWVDGGLYDNYPIDCFDHQNHMQTGELLASEDGRLYNPETLGFRLVTPEHKNYCEGACEHGPENTLTNAVAYNVTLIDAGAALQEEKYDRTENKERTVYIDHLGISMLAFNLSEKEQQALIQSGKEATEDYFIKRAASSSEPTLSSYQCP